MSYAYLFALVVALGILVVQIVMGSRGGHHAVSPIGHGAGHHDHSTDGESGLWTLVLTVRFWTFAGLGFGLSGMLLHHLGLASPAGTAAIAAGAGLASGLFAALVFRVVSRGSASTVQRADAAIGKTGRVVVACGRGTTGQVRVELAGSSIDFLARTDEELIPRGEMILVDEMRSGVAIVSKCPSILP